MKRRTSKPLTFSYNFFYRCARFGYRNLRKLYKKFLKTYLNPYDFISLYPDSLDIKIIDQQYNLNDRFPKFTTITPVLNEEQSIINVLQSIEAQILKPDQVIIVDGGSSDQTIELINLHKQTSALDILLLSSPVKNIGAQRNIAIKHARNNILVNVDAGTYLDKNYMLNLVGPFSEQSGLDLTCGVHYPREEYFWSIYLTPLKHFERRIEPYGACIAYRKDTALKIGLYPEYLTYAGEDTFFCYKYKKQSKAWIFNREAFIWWDHPNNFSETKKKIFNYTVANFEIGLWPYFYYENIFEFNINFGWYAGIVKKNFKQLCIHQSKIEINQRKISGLCFILTNDYINSESSNNTREITKKFIDNNFKTFIINFGDKSKQKPDSDKKYIDLDHSLLELRYYKNFSMKELKYRYENFLNNSVFIIEYSHSEYFKKILDLKKFFTNIKIIFCYNKYQQLFNNHRYAEINAKLVATNSDLIVNDLTNPVDSIISAKDNVIIVNNSIEFIDEIYKASTICNKSIHNF